MSAGLSQTLRKLSPCFERVASSREEGRRVLKLAHKFEDATKKRGKLSAAENRHLRELLLEVATAVSRLTPAAEAALAWPAATANLRTFIGAAYQVEASCVVLAGCGRLVEWRGLSDQDVLRLTAAAQLMLVASPLLRAPMRHVLQQAALRLTAGAAGGRGGMLRLSEEEKELQQAAADLLHLPQLQTAIMGSICGNLDNHRPQVAAAFARSTARPAALLPWLKSAVEALQETPDEAKGTQTFLGMSVPGFMAFVSTILYDPCWSKHSDGIAADPDLQAAIAEVLLVDGMSALAAAVAKRSPAAAGIADALLRLLEHERLLDAVRRQLQQPEASSRTAAALGSVLAALPAQGTDRSQLAELYMSVSAVGVHLCVQTGLDQPAEASGSSLDGGGGSSGSSPDGGGGSGGSSPDGGGGSGGSSPDGGGGSGGSSPDGGGGSSGSVLHAAAWAQVAAQALPKFASALRELAGPNGSAVSRPDSDAAHCRALAAICCNVRGMLLVCRSTAGQPVTAEAYVAWAEAVTAGLQLQPLLSRLDGVFRQQSDSRMQQAAQQLSQRLHVMLFDAMPALAQAPDEAAEQAAAAALPQLLQLHSTACRMCHRLAASGASLAAYETLANEDLHGLLLGLDQVFQAAMDLCVLTRASPLEELREAQALSVGHLAAVNAAQTAAAVMPALGGYQGRPADMVATTLESLLKIGEACPGAVTRALLQPVQAEVVALPKDDAYLPKLLAWLADACSSQPRMASSFVSNGLLAMALDCAGQLANSADGSKGEQADVLLDSIACCLECLSAAGELVGGGIAGKLVEGHAVDSLAAEAAEAASCLQERLATLQQDGAAPLPLAERAQQMQQLLPAAERVAAVVDAHDQLPNQRAAVQLEAARAAAPRRCSYLRCANLQAEGGAVMHKGDRGMRCSACHVAWYCGTACSHADWREGHRRVCKLLGEERRQRKAAAAAHAREE